MPVCPTPALTASIFTDALGGSFASLRTDSQGKSAATLLTMPINVPVSLIPFTSSIKVVNTISINVSSRKFLNKRCYNWRRQWYRRCTAHELASWRLQPFILIGRSEDKLVNTTAKSKAMEAQPVITRLIYAVKKTYHTP